MTGWRQFWAVVGLLMLIVETVPAVYATPVVWTISASQITLNMNLGFQENITALPVRNILIDQSNSSVITDHLLPRLIKLAPGVTITDLNLHVRTYNVSRTWFLFENYTVVIGGAITSTGSRISANAGFVSMNVSEGIFVGGLELNGVGKTYLLANLTSQPSNTAYWINTAPTLTSTIPAQTTVGFFLLDFSWVLPISLWAHQGDVLGQSTNWIYNAFGPRYNLTFGPRSPEGPPIRTYTALYDPSFQLTVPANAWAQGTTIYFDVSTPAETIMPLIISASAVILLVAYLLDRRLGVSQRFTRKKR